jgi:hypothetical protein
MARLRRKEPSKWPLRLFLLFLVLVVAGGVASRFQLTLVPPHVAFAPDANLTDEKKKQLDAALDEQLPSDRDQAIDFALDFTGKSLSFSLGRTTSLDFDVRPRGGGGMQYAALFVAAFDAAAKRTGSTALAYRVRSATRVFGKRVPLASLAEHDWVMVVDPADGARIYLDPMFADAWLGASLSRNVKGGEAIAIPR